jgi:competence protein ComGF
MVVEEELLVVLLALAVVALVEMLLELVALVEIVISALVAVAVVLLVTLEMEAMAAHIQAVVLLMGQMALEVVEAAALQIQETINLELEAAG